ncbi:sugar isomerase domain-containing protein [Allonocardiopsis opalescens]|uniref:Putative phosphosugar-binding protein n=1 Tax=Allonocardiopsis opalescens TaxID=1144618 RepID=A0A2T0QAN0_9ACTN|nr:sugar isomerase domain-containing protein [Allonocardiopsis opalescens]PRY00948.1 putative phosphosugar-binding protein [Allonocardiopsis opalescens]
MPDTSDADQAAAAPALADGNAAHAYFAAVRELLDRAEEAEAGAIEAGARAVAASIAAGGMLHLFGSGHSQLAATEPTARAGGLAPVNVIADPALSPLTPERVSVTERLHGYAGATLALADLRAGEVLIVVSNSGINPVPVEIALGARERGLTVIAVTSLAHSTATASRHRDGHRLFEVADIVIDTHSPAGDTTVSAGGVATGAVSTILSCAVIHALTSRVVQLLAETEAEVPVLVSQNLDRVDDHNDRLLSRYRGRMNGAAR